MKKQPKKQLEISKFLQSQLKILYGLRAELAQPSLIESCQKIYNKFKNDNK
jgi:hypothetical protein